MKLRIAHLIHQDRSSVVPDNIHDSRSDPGLNGIAIVKTRNCRRHKSLGTKFGCIGNTNLGKPRLIPCDLIVDIEVSRIILIFVCKCVRNVSKCIEV